MSDKPLFENMDEQEAMYAPQQLPADNQSDQSDQAIHNRSDQDVGDVDPAVAGAAAGVATSSAASGAAGPTGAGGLPAASPLVASEVLAEDQDRNDENAASGAR
jgi:hypothetical protein